MLRSGALIDLGFFSYEDVDTDQAVLVEKAGSDRRVGFFGLGVGKVIRLRALKNL